MAAMQAFLDDYPVGLDEGRYGKAALPSLPFADGTFDLALCSHLLFLYSRQLDEAFHHASLLDLGGAVSAHLDGRVARLRAAGRRVTMERVNHEFQRGAYPMLRIQREAHR